MKLENIPCIFLIGFMGVGKSTISSHFSQLSQREEVDTDAVIAEEQKMTIPEIFELKGEDYFRSCETKLLEQLKESRKKRFVSCGGGMAMREENIALMKECGIVVLLTAEPETIFERVRNSNNRPILKNRMNVTFIAELMEERRERYERAADVIVKTDHRTIEAICCDIIKQIEAI